MSLFPEYYENGDVFLPDDSSTTKRTTFNFSAVDFTILINVIRLNGLDELVEGEQLGSFRANIKGPNASSVVRGVAIRVAGVIYQVVNDPRYNKIFKRYHLNLKSLNT